MKTRHLLAPLLSILLLVSSCGDDKSSSPNTPDPDAASGTVTSETAARIVTPDGAYIDVPRGAVPLTLDSTTGTMIFSVDRVDASVEVHNPEGVTRVGKIYRFGPEGFVFEQPVEVAIPVEGNYEVGQVMLARINPTTRVAEMYSADYDTAAGVIRALTYELSEWETVLNAAESEPRAWARIKTQCTFTAGGLYSEETVVICPTSFVPRFARDSVLRDPVSGCGPGSPDTWTLPQGTYTFCVAFWYSQIGLSSSQHYQRMMTVPNVVIENYAGWSDAINYTMTFTQAQFDALEDTEERCDCKKQSTPSPGTGDLQVTLTWYNDRPVDLDLWVTDPNLEKCYYGNTPSPSGGVLDRDNLCGSYDNGDPENIFWENAPNGDYLVDVDWFSDCGDSLLEAQAYTVRLAGSFAPITKTGVVLNGQTVRIGRFTLSNNRITQVSFDPIALEKKHPADRAKKK